MHKKHLYIFLLLLAFSLNAQDKTFKKQLDSIQKLRELSWSDAIDLETRINYGREAVALSRRIGVDTLILNSNIDLAWLYSHNINYFDKSKEILHKNLKSAYQSKDSISIAYINFLFGHIHSVVGEKSDSAYYYSYNALKYYNNGSFSKKAKYKILQAFTLYVIASLQEDEKDYLGSQATIIKAINLVSTISENGESLNFLSNAYNLLGVNLKNLKEYDKALVYYKKALLISKDKLNMSINIAELYKIKGDYTKVFDIYNELLKDPDLFEKDANGYATILSNYAFMLFLTKDKNTTKIDSLFTKAHKIFEDLELNYELSANSNDMSEFYHATNDKDKALFYADKAYRISEKSKIYEEELRALKQLSKLKEGEEGKAYLHKYIALNDSLIANERANRNKFARIQFETDQYIKETERLSTQNILISIIAAVLILSLGLLYFIRLQKAKNQKLLFEKEQEEANQEIYGLMLKQQAKLEEVRMQERHRIAEDLHDGILSQLLGTRMNMGFLNLKGDNATLADYRQYLKEIQNIEKDIRALSHELKGDEE